MNSTTRQICTTKKELNRIRWDAAELGYSALSAEEKAIADSFDAGTLVIKDDK